VCGAGRRQPAPISGRQRSGSKQPDERGNATRSRILAEKGGCAVTGRKVSHSAQPTQGSDQDDLNRRNRWPALSWASNPPTLEDWSGWPPKNASIVATPGWADRAAIAPESPCVFRAWTPSQARLAPSEAQGRQKPRQDRITWTLRPPLREFGLFHRKPLPPQGRRGDRHPGSPRRRGHLVAGGRGRAGVLPLKGSRLPYMGARG